MAEIIGKIDLTVRIMLYFMQMLLCPLSYYHHSGFSNTPLHSPNSMESKAFPFHCPFLPIPVSQNYFLELSNENYRNNSIRWRYFSGGRSGGSRWDWDANVNPNRQSRLSDAYLTEEYYDEDEFGFRNAAKKRMWWSDDFYGEDGEEEEEDEGFGIHEASIGFNWIFKVLRAFGWMIPAVITSLVLGTGPDAILISLALPLAQSAFSLVTETLWGRSSAASKPKSTNKNKNKNKKRTFARTTSNPRWRKTKETNTQTRKGAGDYKSWVASNNASDKNEKMNPHNFGGWDELDNQVRVDKIPNTTPKGK